MILQVRAIDLGWCNHTSRAFKDTIFVHCSIEYFVYGLEFLCQMYCILWSIEKSEWNFECHSNQWWEVPWIHHRIPLQQQWLHLVNWILCLTHSLSRRTLKMSVHKLQLACTEFAFCVVLVLRKTDSIVSSGRIFTFLFTVLTFPRRFCYLYIRMTCA